MRALHVACACLVFASAAAAQNLLTNGSFNGNLNGWSYGGGTTYDSTHDATGISGSGSAKVLIPASSGAYVVRQCVSVNGSTLYKAGGKVLIPSGQTTAGWASIRVQFYGDANCGGPGFGYGETPYLTNAGSWISADTGFVRAPAEAVGALVYVYGGNNGASGAADFQINVDDMYFVAGDAAYALWLPAVIHKDVPSKNAKWRSDVAVLNRSTSTANLTITMYPVAGPVTQTTQLAGSAQLLLTDVAGWLGVMTDSGPLEVTSDQEFFLSGRTYNQVDETHTYGQDYDGEETSELLLGQESAWLPQLTEDSAYRTNIGITNTSVLFSNVTVTLYDASGNQVWQDTHNYPPGGFYQYQQPFLAVGGIASGYAKVTVNSGSGVVAYASVTDNNTGDPTTITMKR